jgi:hypothetical protein
MSAQYILDCLHDCSTLEEMKEVISMEAFSIEKLAIEKDVDFFKRLGRLLEQLNP